MKSGIYLIKNMVNGKVYIGSSVNLVDRWWHHLNSLSKNKHANSYLQYSFNKHGKDSFEFFIITYCHQENLLKKEDFYIRYYRARDRKYGYNINEAERIIMTEETKKKISEKLKCRRLTPMTEEIKKKISIALKGKYSGCKKTLCQKNKNKNYH